LVFIISFRIFGGKISIPTEITNTKLKENLVEDVTSGRYSIGELVVPQTFKTLAVRNGEVYPETFGTMGPLYRITAIF